MKLKKIVVKIIEFLGYRISKSNERTKDVTFDVLNSNFEKLCLSFESIFASLPENQGRITILKKMLGTSPGEAYHIIQSVHNTANIKGDICEFGVAQGVTSQLIGNEIKNLNKKLHLFDSFEGLPQPSEEDVLIDDIFDLGTMEAYKGKMKFSERNVIQKLDQIHFPKTRTIIHKGFIDQTFRAKNNLPQKISFAYVDFDFYKPILNALNFIHLVMDEGGETIIDDYNHFSAGAKAAVDEFLEKNSDSYELKIPNEAFGAFAIFKKIK